MKKQKNERKDKEIKAKGLLAPMSIIVSCVVSIIAFVVGNTANEKFSPEPIETAIISVILVVIGLISWLCVTMLLRKLLNDDKKIRSSINNQVGDEKQFDLCEACIEEKSLCCLSEAISSQRLKLSINEEQAKEERLYLLQYVFSIEWGGNRGSKWKDVWIFSDDLTTEMDALGGVEPVVAANIATWGTRYKMFYISTKNKEQELNGRMDLLKKSLTSKEHSDLEEKLTFCPIDAENGYIGKNTVPLLCGSVMFGNKSDSDGLVFQEGYLSLRESKDTDAIFYKMPRCMLRQYAEFFKNKAAAK